MMFGPQVLLNLNSERRIPIYKCIVCDFETPDRMVEAAHVERCGSMVLREHHGMAKTAYLAGLAALESKRTVRGKPKMHKSWSIRMGGKVVAGQGADGASDCLAAVGSMESGPDEAEAIRGPATSERAEAPASAPSV